MDREEPLGGKDVVSLFLRVGYQLDATALDFLVKNPQKIGQIIDILGGGVSQAQAPTTITSEYIKKLIGASTKQPIPGGGMPTVSIIKRISLRESDIEKTSIEEYVGLYNRHYEKIKKILIEKMSTLGVTSINKIQNQKEPALIVMVREKDHIEKSILVEDPTGNTTLSLPNNASERLVKEYDSIIEDDVLGILCKKPPGGRGHVIEKLFWPDVPLKRKINKTDEDVCCLFVSGFDGVKELSEPDLDGFFDTLSKRETEMIYIFILDSCDGIGNALEDKIPTPLQKKIKIFSYPIDEINMISIGGVIALLIPQNIIYHQMPDGSSVDETAVVLSLLKKRWFKFGRRPIFLESSPDVVVTTHRGPEETPQPTNYKGVTILSVESFRNISKSWLLELRSRGINKLDFS